MKCYKLRAAPSLAEMPKQDLYFARDWYGLPKDDREAGLFDEVNVDPAWRIDDLDYDMERHGYAMRRLNQVE